MTPGQKRRQRIPTDTASAKAAGYTLFAYHSPHGELLWGYFHPGKVARGVGWDTEEAAWEAAGRSWRSNYGSR